jgi:hypothetical protein
MVKLVANLMVKLVVNFDGQTWWPTLMVKFVGQARCQRKYRPVARCQTEIPGEIMQKGKRSRVEDETEGAASEVVQSSCAASEVVRS